MLFFFTSTCPYCARSFGFARMLHEQLGNLSVDFVGVALDGQVPDYDDTGEPAVTYRALTPVDSSNAKDLRVNMVPTIVLVDGELIVLEVWIGELNSTRVDEIVQSARIAAALGE